MASQVPLTIPLENLNMSFGDPQHLDICILRYLHWTASLVRRDLPKEAPRLPEQHLGAVPPKSSLIGSYFKVLFITVSTLSRPNSKAFILLPLLEHSRQVWIQLHGELWRKETNWFFGFTSIGLFSAHPKHPGALTHEAQETIPGDTFVKSALFQPVLSQVHTNKTECYRISQLLTEALSSGRKRSKLVRF